MPFFFNMLQQKQKPASIKTSFNSSVTWVAITSYNILNGYNYYVDINVLKNKT
jgi:hypothetical protein